MAKNIIAFCLLVIRHSYGDDFIVDDVTVIGLNGSSSKYFGYSLLLQKGDIPEVIVGAPREEIIRNTPYGGEVFQCGINEHSKCQSIFLRSSYPLNPNGDFLGMSLDGESHTNGLVMACSPRASNPEKLYDKNIYTYGLCLYRKNYKIYTVQASNFPNSKGMSRDGTKWYFDYGFGLFGFSACLSNKEYSAFGAPGLKMGTGATMLLPRPVVDWDKSPKPIVFSTRQFSVNGDSNFYFGYSVYTAKNSRDNITWYIAGSPRGNNLMGNATLFTASANSEMQKLHDFLGDEFGCYFGASALLVDVNGDGILEVFIGAPTKAGQSYDEGCVYFYKKFGDGFRLQQKLTGSKQMGGRFGTCLSQLGDIDLDGFEDVSISAPYENDREGAVYIYKGAKDGLEDNYSERLSPSSFNPPIPAKGFGLGISRGNDIDRNGHNDIAVGAYKSDKVFVIRSYGILIFESAMHVGVKTLTEATTKLPLQFCIVKCVVPSPYLDISMVDFDVTIILDGRSIRTNISDKISVRVGTEACRSFEVQLRPLGKDTSPFEIEAFVNVIMDKHLKALGNWELKTEIPYANCSRKVCTTGLSITIQSKGGKKIVLGQDRYIEIEASVTNDGDPAYLCDIIIEAPKSLQLRNAKNCNKFEKHYICTFSRKLDKNGTEKKTYIFDFKNLDSKEVEISASVTAAGENKAKYKNRDSLRIPVDVNSSAYIVGRSFPDAIEMKRSGDPNNTVIVHQFTIGKSGPSPLELDVTVFIPPIFKFLHIEAKIDNDRLTCIPPHDQGNVTEKELVEHIKTIPISHDRMIMIYCDDIEECIQYKCEGHLDTPNQKAVFEVRVLLISESLVHKYRHELQRKDLITYFPIAVQKNSDGLGDRIMTAAPFVVFVHGSKFIPLWVYMLGGFIGAAVLTLLIFSLYKGNFFKREYKDYLTQEQLLLRDKEGSRCSNNHYQPPPVRFSDEGSVYENFSDQS